MSKRKSSLPQFWRWPRLQSRLLVLIVFNPILWLILTGVVLLVRRASWPADVAMEHLGETEYQLKYVSAPAAVCNDGSPLAYYYKSVGGDSAQPWLIYLEGGAACTTVEECQLRAQLYPDLVSSQGYPSAQKLTGIFSDNPDLNPSLAAANAIYVRYCSSDHWLGAAQHLQPDGTTLHFGGQANVLALITELQQSPPPGYPTLKTAPLVVLVGQSAGGVGVVNLIDSVAAQLPGVPVKGVLEGSYMIDRVGSVGEFATARESAAQGDQLREFWQPVVDADCALARADDPLSCAGQNVMSYVTSSLFVLQDDRDSFFTNRLTADERQQFAAQVHDLLATRSAAFISHEGYHSVLQTSRFFTLQTEGVSLIDVLDRWLR